MTKANKKEISDFKDYVDDSYCLKTRRIYITEINEKEVDKFIRVLTLLESINNKPITIFINSGGGYIYDGFALFDFIRLSSCHIITHAVGKIMSMGLVLYVAGDERLAGNNTTFMAHKAAGGSYGSSTEVEIDSKELTRINNSMTDILVARTSKDKVFWNKMMSKGNHYFNTQQAIEYGVI